MLYLYKKKLICFACLFFCMKTAEEKTCILPASHFLLEASAIFVLSSPVLFCSKPFRLLCFLFRVFLIFHICLQFLSFHQQASDQLEVQNNTLQSQISKLHDEIKQLEFMLDSHSCSRHMASNHDRVRVPDMQ